MIRGRGGARAAVAIALFALARSGAAALDVPGAPPGPIRVALLSTTPDDPLAGRLDAELRTIGVDVSRSVVSPTQTIEAQVRDALAGGARAVVVADGHRTDVWIAEPGSDKVALRQELEVDQDSGQQAILSLRTVEFLRISLGLVSESTVVPLTPALAVPKTLPPPPASVPPVHRWATIDATAGAFRAGGGGGMTVLAGVAARAQIVGMIGAELCLYAPLTEAVLTGTVAGDPSGGGGTFQAQTSVWMAGGGVLFAPRSDRPLSIELAAGTLATAIRLSGLPSSNKSLTPNADVDVRGAFYGRVAARLRLAPRLALRIDIFGGAVISPPHLLFGQQEIAVWGPGFVAGLGGAELGF